MKAGEDVPLRLLQGVILLVVFIKIQCLGSRGDPLARIVCKFSALTVCRNNAFLNAEHLLVIYLGSTGAIAAGLCNFLSE